MRQTLLYALLFSVPPGVASGSGVYLLAGQALLGLAFGCAVGLAVFVLVVLGSEYGSTEARSVVEP